MEKYIDLDGHRFVRDEKTDYYLSNRKINGRRVRLHRYIWEKHNGPIPGGYEIHHIDHNKLNNDPENLEIILIPKHRSVHNKIIKNTDAWKEKFKAIRQMGSDAHKRPEERKKQSVRSKGQWEERKKNPPRIEVCKMCGDNYETYHLGEVMFCSKKCKAKDFRKRFREEHGYGYDRKLRPDRKKGKYIERDTG